MKTENAKQNDGKAKRKKKYDDAPEVEPYIRRLIRDVHTSLTECKIKVQFRFGGFMKKGEIVCSTTKRISPDVAAATGIDFMITVNADEFWNRAEEPARMAEIDHALSHICPGTPDKDGSPRWLYVDHDCAEFAGVARRNGEYNESLRRMRAALNGEEEKPTLAAVS